MALGTRPHRVGRRRRMGRRGAVGHLLHDRRAPAARRGRRPSAVHALGRRAEAARPRGAAPLRRRRAAARRARQLPRRARQGVARGRSLQACPKTILLISHDRQLLVAVAKRVVTLEGRTGWVHGGSFATWHDAREARLERIDEEHRRWQEERKKMQEALVEYRRRASMGSDKFASRVRATKSKIERFEAAPPTEKVPRPPGDHAAGRRAHGQPRDHLRAARAPRAHRSVRRRGELRRARRRARPERHRQEPLPPPPRRRARRPRGHAAPRRRRPRLLQPETHDHPELAGPGRARRTDQAAWSRGKAMAALRRYGVHGGAASPSRPCRAASRPASKMPPARAGRQHAAPARRAHRQPRLASAEALEEALQATVGTVARGEPRRGSCAASTASSSSAATPGSRSTSSPSSSEELREAPRMQTQMHRASCSGGRTYGRGTGPLPTARYRRRPGRADRQLPAPPSTR